jgi:intracellular sulfur oxidation DsrE/DsrF family protein
MKTRIEKIEEFLKGLTTEVDILNCVDLENVNSYDDIYNQVNDNNGFDIEIIYYSNAMEYLSNNDNSLRESIEIADGMGFELKSINSELLASLLASQNAREEFTELESEITEFFENLDEEEEDEEETEK